MERPAVIETAPPRWRRGARPSSCGRKGTGVSPVREKWCRPADSNGDLRSFNPALCLLSQSGIEKRDKPAAGRRAGAKALLRRRRRRNPLHHVKEPPLPEGSGPASIPAARRCGRPGSGPGTRLRPTRGRASPFALHHLELRHKATKNPTGPAPLEAGLGGVLDQDLMRAIYIAGAPAELVSRSRAASWTHAANG
jgi:hypothetical protein